jgi:hypothetical protein
MSSRGTERSTATRADNLNELTAALEREARPLPNLKKVTVLLRRLRLGRLHVPLPIDRIDQMVRPPPDG